MPVRRPLPYVLVIASAVAISVIVAMVTHPAWQDFVETSGANISTTDRILDYAAGIGWGIVLTLFIFLWPVPWRHKAMLVPAWLVRCLMTLAVMLPYEAHYSILDCWVYFPQAHMALAEVPGRLMNGGADLVLGLGALHLKIGPDSYHAMKLSFAMFGFVAVYLFYRAAEILLGRHTPVVFWALTLYPSVLFWSSILGKDPVILAAIALHVWGLVNVVVRGRNGYLVAVLAGIAATSAVRIWMGPILILPCLFILGARIKHIGWRIAAVLLVGFALVALGPATMDRLKLNQTSDLVEATRTVSRGLAGANSALGDDRRMDTLWDVVTSAPQGLFDTYFRPLPGDVPNLFGWLAGFENLGLLALCIWALFRIRLDYFRNHLFLWGAVLLLTWGIAYSFVAYKDLGTAVRFKLQIMPVLLGMIGYTLRQPSRHWVIRRSSADIRGLATPQKTFS